MILRFLGNKYAVTAIRSVCSTISAVFKQKLISSPIREAGATTQMILLPGNNYTSAETFVSSGSAEALGMVTNPDGTFTNLIMDVHKYLDYDNSLVQLFPCQCPR
jgi:hypothetical protein